MARRVFLSTKKNLAKTFKIDVTKCQACQGDLRKIGAVVDGGEVQRYLKHVGLDHTAPPRGPPSFKQAELDFSEWPEYESHAD